MKKSLRFVRLYGVAAFAAFMVFALSARFSSAPLIAHAQADAQKDDSLSEESPYDARLRKLLRGQDAEADQEKEQAQEKASPPDSDDPSSEPLSDAHRAPNDAASGEDVPEENAIDELMRSLKHSFEASEKELPVFDAGVWELEGNWFIVGEKSGSLKPGKTSRIRLIAQRKSDGIYDRALALEIATDGQAPFLIRIPENVRGFDSNFDLVNLRTLDSFEILLTVSSLAPKGTSLSERVLVLSIDENKSNILYDSETTQIPAVVGRFFNKWRAEIIVKETGSHTLIDLFPRKDFYIRRRVYNGDAGQLRTSINLWAGPNRELRLVDIDNDGIYELRKISELYGAGRDDRVAYVDAVLRWHAGEWQVFDCWVAPAEDLRLLPIPVEINRERPGISP